MSFLFSRHTQLSILFIPRPLSQWLRSLSLQQNRLTLFPPPQLSLQLFYKLTHPLNPHPLKCGFFRLRIDSLKNQPYRLQHIRYIIQSPYLSLQLLLI